MTIFYIVLVHVMKTFTWWNMQNREAEKNEETYAEIDEESERNMKFSLIEEGKMPIKQNRLYISCIFRKRRDERLRVKYYIINF